MIDPKVLLEFCETDAQKRNINALIEHGTIVKTANALGINRRTLYRSIKIVERRAASNGISPHRDLIHQTAEGFKAKRISTAYKADGSVGLQWVIQEPEKQKLDEILAEFREGLKDEFKGLHKPIEPPVTDISNVMCCYMIGDHHLGNFAWAEQTGESNYDTNIAVTLLEEAIDNLVRRTPKTKDALLVNLGDFFHSNNIRGETGSGTLLETDTRYARTIRKGVNLLKRSVIRLLEHHEKVTVVNVRGNHDPDSSLWLNEAMNLYFENEPRVEIPNNYNKFQHIEYGNNLIVMHHGDKVNPQRIYEAITRRLSKEWGESKYRFGWLGHIHHKQVQDIGGMRFESFNILAPVDEWHSSKGYGSSRSMTCILLSKNFGEDSRIIVNADQIGGTDGK
jgi:UDP-2,3-diacylglucosamine pyrophosphatase LpxH